MTTTFTDAQLTEWAGLGPWAYRPEKHDDWGIVRAGHYFVCQARDRRFMDDGYLNLCREEKRDPHEIPARLIAAAPALAAELKKAREEVERLQKVLQSIENTCPATCDFSQTLKGQTNEEL
jgi:hypothetical protein